jgi:hypothetical protein
MARKKGFGPIEMLIVIVVVGTVLLGGSYLFPQNHQQTQAPVAPSAPTSLPATVEGILAGSSTWPVYSNRLGYQVHYPTGADVTEAAPLAATQVQWTSFNLIKVLGVSYPQQVSGDQSEVHLPEYLSSAIHSGIINNPNNLTVKE